MILFVYLFERQKERERVWWEDQREKQTVLNTEPDVGLDLTTLRSWPEPKSRVRCSTI